jgi:hypothetical protein
MGCPLSTLSFLKYLENLELLNISDCPNLVNADFGVITTCRRLETLHVGFTQISKDVLTDIVAPGLPNLTFLEANNVEFTCDAITKLMEHRYLMSFSMSLEPGASYGDFKNVENHFVDCIFSVSNKRFFLGL